MNQNPKGASVNGSIYQQLVEWKTKAGENRSENRWIAQYRFPDNTGKLRTYRDTKSTTKRQAQKALRELEERARENQQLPHLALEQITVGKYLDDWHEERKRNKTIELTTARHEQRHVRELKKLVGSLPLRALQPQEIEGLLQHLRQTRRHADGRIQARMIQQIYRTLSKALSDVRPRLDQNPCTAIAVEDRPKTKKPETSIFSPDELRDITAAAYRPRKGDSIPDLGFAVLIQLLASTGCRISEALALTWSDIDFQEQTVRVRATLIDLKGGGLIRKSPKTRAGNRDIRVPNELIHRLQMLRTSLGAVPIATRPVFPSERGTWQRKSNIQRRRWTPLLEELELKPCGFHRLRHTYASVILSKGIDINTLARLLGHANPSITLTVYSHFIPGREVEAATAIGEIITGRKRKTDRLPRSAT